MNLDDTVYYKRCSNHWKHFWWVWFVYSRFGRSRFYRFRLSSFIMQCRTVYVVGLLKVFSDRYKQLASPVSTSQWFLRGFWAFRCRIDAFVYRRVRTVRKRVRKRVDLFFRVVWIGLGLRIGRKGYRNDAFYIVIVIIVDFDDIWLKLKKL